MADIAAVLDSAGLAGLQAGKKGHKGHAQGTGQAEFIVALMSQMRPEGMPKGKMSDLGELVADVDSSGKSLHARSLQPATAPAVAAEPFASPSTSSQPGTSQPTTAQRATSQPASVPSIVRQHQQDRIAGYPVVEGESADAGKKVLPGQGGEADVVTDVTTEEVVRRVEAGVADVSPIPPLPGSPLAAAIQAVSGNPAQEASVPEYGGNKDAPALSRVLAGDTKFHAHDPEKPGLGQAGVSANAAGDGGNDGQVLPAIASDVTDGEANPLQVSSGNTASTLLQSSATASPPSPDASAVRPFEQTLRQLDARLNVSVEAHVKTPAFASEFGEKVVWLASRQGQVAEMTLNPPQLGSVEVRLTVAGGEAGAHFFSANPAVREAIEAALPKLRDLMAQAGINLGEANVRDQSFAQGRGAERPETGASTLFPGTETAIEGTGFGSPRAVGLGLVDLYA